MSKIYCNPLNLEYHYQVLDTPYEHAVFREMADPTITLFKGTYYLFASMNGGFWYSDDLYEWTYRATPELPIYDYAPDVREVAGQLVFCANHKGDRGAQLWRTPDPLSVPFKLVSEPFEFADPDLFCDDDGRVYLYWGSSTTEPIYGIELDPQTLTPVGQRHSFFGSDTSAHGWERKGENNAMGEPKTERDRKIREVLGVAPWIEGCYMSKHDGHYYLQYAGNGTNFNTYCDGVYVSENPLGPFRYQRLNPFSAAPGGFMPGAGHGSTFRDKDGNWWHVSTMRISKNGAFERRIGLWPCDFDEEGTLHCNQNFPCFPHALPEGPRQDMDAIEPRMMLLSLGATATASSWQEGFEPARGTDEDCQTWWAAAEGDESPWYELDLGTEKRVEAVQVNFADHQIPLPDVPIGKSSLDERTILLDRMCVSYVLSGSTDGKSWAVLHDNRADGTDLVDDFVLLDEPVSVRYLRLTDVSVPLGARPAVSGLRVFGHAGSSQPQQVESAKVSLAKDGLNAHLSWEPAAGALGYNVRYGLAPDRLYLSWEVDGPTELELTTLNAGETYYAAIDSFNECGVTAGHVFALA